MTSRLSEMPLGQDRQHEEIFFNRRGLTSAITVSMHCKSPFWAAASTREMDVPISSQQAAWAPSTGNKSRDIVFVKYCKEKHQRHHLIVWKNYPTKNMFNIWAFVRLKNGSYLLQYGYTASTTLHSHHKRSDAIFPSSGSSFCLNMISSLSPDCKLNVSRKENFFWSGFLDKRV